jgi:parvulin-like peptidyl-prolyl isomerase
MDNSSTVKLTREEINGKNPDLFQKIKDLKQGLIQSVVSFGDKFTIIYVQDFVPAGVNDFEDSKKEIVDLLLKEKRNLLWDAWYDTYFIPFKENSEIFINLGGE